MSEQHTKGPWKAVKSQKPKHKTAIFIAYGKAGYVAKVYGHDGEPVEANASLIAAAPELAAFVGKVIQWKPGDSIKTLQKEAQQLYRAAIVKARPDES